MSLRPHGFHEVHGTERSPCRIFQRRKTWKIQFFCPPPPTSEWISCPQQFSISWSQCDNPVSPLWRPTKPILVILRPIKVSSKSFLTVWKPSPLRLFGQPAMAFWGSLQRATGAPTVSGWGKLIISGMVPATSDDSDFRRGRWAHEYVAPFQLNFFTSA